MIVSFNSQSLRDCCATLEQAAGIVGQVRAQELIAVLSDAEAAETAAELIELYAPNVTLDGFSISFTIGTQYRLSFVAVGVAIRRDRKADLDWGAVRRLKMMDISPC